MSFERFATIMIVAGAGLGLAATSLVPTSARSQNKPYAQASAADYPEITAVTYESYPIAQVPLMHRAPLRLASWQDQWADPHAGDDDEPVPGYVEPEVQPDPQIAEDEVIAVDEEPEPATVEHAVANSSDGQSRPVTLSLSVLP